MNPLLKHASLALIVLTLAADAGAQRSTPGDRPTLRRESGGVNSAPQPGNYTVVSVDSGSQVVRLRADDGSTADVFVGSDTYDISKLNAGDRITVNFLEPDGPSSRLKAANIWPAR